MVHLPSVNGKDIGRKSQKENEQSQRT
uniref:Uncharacterized protein n=1 Tax=Anguilla anguilla TaxID=7936 RepID=A0A0E9U2Q3_ANGAN